MKIIASLLTPAVVFTVSVWAETNSKNSTGVEPIYSYKGGLNEAINIYNGNLNVSVPLLTLKGRAGMDLAVYLSYDTSQFNIVSDGLCWRGKASLNYSGPTSGRWVPSFAPSIVEWFDPVNQVRKAEIQLEGGTVVGRGSLTW